jgi:hypothetical protein
MTIVGPIELLPGSFDIMQAKVSIPAWNKTMYCGLGRERNGTIHFTHLGDEPHKGWPEAIENVKPLEEDPLEGINWYLDFTSMF